MRYAGRLKLRRRITTLFRRFRHRTKRFCNNNFRPARLSWFQKAGLAVRRALGRTRPGSGYVRVGHEVENHGSVPKGYLAVYVGHGSNEERRVLVPVMQFNHPLFGELLKEAEAEFGFEHPGGITIPCRISEFENVRMRIIGGGESEGRRRRRPLMTWRKEKMSWSY